MTRYRPVLIEGVAGLSLRRGQNAPAPVTPPPRPPASAPASPARARKSVGAAAAPDDPGAEARLARARALLAGSGVAGEPDPATAGLADWQDWRDRLLELPRDDSVRVALAVAEAQIARLRERLR